MKCKLDENLPIEISTDIALKYGYESPVSFARAFRSLHGITPTEVRRQSTILKAYPRLSFYITINSSISGKKNGE